MTTPLRVLIVEDKPADAELMVLRLTKEGFKLDWKRVQTEADFTTALATLWDLILADWSLPQFSGLRALQILQESGLKIPFIIVSGAIGEEAAIDAMHKGANDYLLKDRPERLGEAIHQALAQKRLQEEKKQTNKTILMQSSALNAAANAIIITDLNGSIEWANPAFCALSGYSSEEIIGKNPRDLVKSGKHDRAFYKKMWDCILTGRVWHGELINRRKDGQEYDEDLTITPLLDAEGGVNKFIAIKQDISERKRAEEALRKSQELFRIAQDMSPDGFTILRPVRDAHERVVDFTWVYENAAVARLNGTDPEAVVGQRLLELFPGHRDTQFMRAYIQVAESGETCIFEEEYSGESMLKPTSFRIVVVPMAGDIAILAQDTTERKQAVEKQAQTYELLTNLASLVPGVIYQYRLYPDGSSAFPYSSPGMYSIYEVIPEQVREDATLVFGRLHPEDADRVSNLIFESARTLEEFYCEFRVILPEQGLRWRWSQAHPERTEDGGTLWHGIISDITERKQAEQKAEQLWNQNQLILKSVGEGILGLTKDGKHTFVNPEAVRMLGYGMDELIGKESHPLWHHTKPDGSPNNKEDCMIHASIQGGVMHRVSNEVFWRKDGTSFPVEYSSNPIFEEGQVIGVVVTFQDITDRKKSEAEISLRVNQLATAREIGKTLSETLDLEQIYERLYQAANKLLPDSETMFVSLFDDEKKEFRCVFAMSESQRLDISHLPPAPLEPPGVGTQSEVVHTRNPLIVDNLPERLKKVSLVVNVGEGGEDPQSGLYVPMLAKGDVIGVVIVQSQKLNRYTPDDAEMLSLVANTAASAIQNAQLFTQTERRLQQISAMHSIDATISSSFDLELTFTILLEILTTQLGVDAADVLVLNKNTQILECRGRRGFHTQALQHTRLPIGQGLAGKAALERKMLVLKSLPDKLNPPFNSPELAAEGFVAYMGMPLTSKGEIVGVLEIFHREKLEPTKEWLDYLENLAGQAAIAIDNSLLFTDLQRSNLDLSLAYDATILGWSNALDLRDKETEGHSQRVTQMTLQLAVRMELSEEELVHVHRGALLHDIGKMGVPDSILLKAGPLTDEEWASMRKHPLLAYNLLAPIPYLQKALEIPYCHHEKWDGSGYPRGLKGEQIPLPARIFAVADVWDALISDRPYRKAWTKAKALDHIREQAGKHFDAQVVKEFLKLDAIKKKKG